MSFLSSIGSASIAWSLSASYGDDPNAAVDVACMHGGHESAAEVGVLYRSRHLRSPAKDPRNREATLVAMVAAQEAA